MEASLRRLKNVEHGKDGSENRDPAIIITSHRNWGMYLFDLYLIKPLIPNV